MRKILLLFTICTYIFTSCNQEKKPASITISSPEAGTIVKSGENFAVDVNLPSDLKPDSIVYFVDSTIVLRRSDTAKVEVGTDNLFMGNHLVTAKIYSGSVAEEVSSNIVIVAAKAPVQYTYEVVNTYPHDTTSFTEGLEYHDGALYESTGLEGSSSLLKVELKTGKILKRTDLDKKYFGEGITVVGDKIIQITYRNGVGFVYDKSSFEKLSEFNYHAGAEGWGLAFDGRRILNTDGTNTIHFLNKDTYQKEGDLEVYDDKGPVDQLNEIEYIDGKIYANLWRVESPEILVIDPNTGAVEAEINLKALLPEYYDQGLANVLNGIAWDAGGRRMFVTGKKWDKLYEIKVINK